MPYSMTPNMIANDERVADDNIIKFHVQLFKDAEMVFDFQGFDVPSEFSPGVTQALAVHKFLGGGQTIDEYGYHPDPITITGTLFNIPDDKGTSYTTALQRSHELMQLVKDGGVYTFSAGPYKYRVLLEKYVPQIRHAHMVDYSLTMQVLIDAEDEDFYQTLKIDPVLAMPDLTADFSLEDLLEALTRALNLLMACTAALINLIRDLKKDPWSVFRTFMTILPGLNGTLANIFAIGKAFAQVCDQMTAQIENVMQLIDDLQNADPVSTVEPAEIAQIILPSVQKFIDQQAAINLAILEPDELHYAQLGTIIPPLGNLVPSLAASAVVFTEAVAKGTVLQYALKALVIQEDADGDGIVTVNPNLYELATKEYGSPLMWQFIAEANCLTTPTPTGTFDGVSRLKLKIPKRDTITGAITTTRPMT